MLGKNALIVGDIMSEFFKRIRFIINGETIIDTDKPIEGGEEE